MVTNERAPQPMGTRANRSRRRLTALAAGLCLLIPVQAGAQQAQPSPDPASSDPGRSRVAWTLIGGGVGFGAGLLIGVGKFDDAVYAERKIWTTALIGAAAGGVTGGLLSRRLVNQPESGADRDPLWNGMLIGAATGAGVGMWWVPKAHCKVEFNPECPTALRVAVGIPAVATGAAIGALIDRAIGPSGAPAPGSTKTTLVSPVIGPGVAGVLIQRTF